MPRKLHKFHNSSTNKTNQQLLNIAQAAAASGQFEELITFCQKRVITSPKDEVAWSEGVRSLMLAGRLDEAKDFARRGLNELPQSYAIRINLIEILIKRGEFPIAVTVAQQATTLRPNDYYGSVISG